jgi:hypothetical protein
MLPWTWAIAYRRFHQGVLIRFNRSQTVGVGTLVRLGTNLVVLLIGYQIGTLAGIVVATSAVATGVVAEAVYAGLAVQPVLRGPLRQAPAVTPAISLPSFLSFYVPLIFTSLLTLLSQPIGSAALSRMPLALESLAAYPVITGLIFLFRSLGMSFNEVVVALLDEAHSWHSLKRFTTYLGVLTTLAFLLIAATPLSLLWLSRVSGLSSGLTNLALPALWLALPLPGLNVLQSWLQGNLLHSRRTRTITESVIVFLVTCSLLLAVGVAWGEYPGLYIGMSALTLASLAQTAWLWLRSLPALRSLALRDQPALASE